ncbi:hypothetical protein J6590_047015 [Homalodisca vitripennis]|nr:hypothetical protein J6590_047015 [Homalodisca vitripennis]
MNVNHRPVIDDLHGGTAVSVTRCGGTYLLNLSTDSPSLVSGGRERSVQLDPVLTPISGHKALQTGTCPVSLSHGDKPHACELCHKKFALACNLRAHMKTHEAGDTQEECMRCGKMYLASGQVTGYCPQCLTSQGAPGKDLASCGDSGSEESCTTEDREDDDHHVAENLPEPRSLGAPC